MEDNQTNNTYTGPKHAQSQPKETAGSFFKSLIIDIVIAVALAAIVLFFIRPTIVKQSSMEDTLHENDYMIMYRQAYRSHTPERGDIIIFQSELYDEDSGDDKLLIKRVIGNGKIHTIYKVTLKLIIKVYSVFLTCFNFEIG